MQRKADKMKIFIINHTFQKREFSKRWKLLAQKHLDWDITLLAPSKFEWGSNKNTTFGIQESIDGYIEDENNFHVKTIRIKESSIPSISWKSSDMIQLIKREKPDVVYHIGTHAQESLMQILKLKKIMKSNFKVFAFSMRGPAISLKGLKAKTRLDKNLFKKLLRLVQYSYFKHKHNILNKNCDAIFCHYPEAINVFRSEGYKGPIFMQTQVGVDSDIFYPDPLKRSKKRDELNLNDSFVFASAVRFNEEKGTLKVLEALPKHGNWKYILMGWGMPEEVEKVKKTIMTYGLEDKVILTGFKKWDEVADLWNASDCAIHFPQTTVSWEETFSLSVVQAMACGLPVIGSNSGSVPYQLGPDGIIVDENSVADLSKVIQWAIDNPNELKSIGEKMLFRASSFFEIRHLNELFYTTVESLKNGTVLESTIDQTKISL